jgi:hypothetical protein
MISQFDWGKRMSETWHTEAEIVAVLKHVEAKRKAGDGAREDGGSRHTIYAWRVIYGEWR